MWISQRGSVVFGTELEHVTRIESSDVDWPPSFCLLICRMGDAEIWSIACPSWLQGNAFILVN